VIDEIRQLARALVYPIHGGHRTLLFRAAIVTWITFAVVLSVKVLVSPVRHSCYPAFDAGCRLWWAELNMYHGTWHEFRYGPAFAVAFSPLVNLPIALGQLVWMWLNLAAFFWSLRVLVREILPAAWTPDREGAFLLIVLAGSYRGMWALQSNMLLFALVVAGMHAIMHKRFGWAALWLALPVHVKIWPLVAALLLIACWPRKLAARFACALVAVAALPLLTKWPSVVIQRYHEWYLALIGPMQVRHSYRDLWTAWELIEQPVNAEAYFLMQVATGTLALALCLWQQRRGATPPQLLTFILAMWTSWQLFVGPGTERNTFGLIAPLTAWAVVTCLSQGRGRVVMATVLGLTMIAAVGQVERTLADSFPIVFAAHPIGVLLFACWFVVHSFGWRTADRAPAVATLRARTHRETFHRAPPVAAEAQAA
jgi:hypothetical protein